MTYQESCIVPMGEHLYGGRGLAGDSIVGVLFNSGKYSMSRSRQRASWRVYHGRINR